MSRWASVALVAGALWLTGCNDAPGESTESYGFGHPVTATELSSWDIDVGPDGVGLPPGSGTAELGEPVYLAQCAACHGEFAEGRGRFPSLIGSPEVLTSDRPSKTVGSYWPHATTLWDYIYRAMPLGHAQSLTPDEVYGITAYILAMNDIIGYEDELNAETLLQVQMPNRDGFVTATGPDIDVEACMQDCVDAVEVTSRATESAISQADE